ncbi:PREDICTED: preprotein translocase subunit SECE1 [Ipomoea nil]|uniref:preprotein translocase subunit SECE1 n=1 Tax=Ipomoea nil TaxID=35883 RepID=UPI0009014E22|nr:PREDICTED: preprotein translocase subunit SECE1 [Ipomoea nil]
MAHSLSFSLRPTPAFVPPPSAKLHNPTFAFTIKPKRILLRHSKPSILVSTPKSGRLRATQDPESNGNPQEDPPQSTTIDAQSAGDSGDEASRLGSEIRKAMEEREQKEASFWDGVAEEIREIEWPALGKVLGTTGVVLGVMAGSSVVLLTVNAVLAELSDRVFAGKGVQDFFG